MLYITCILHRGIADTIFLFFNRVINNIMDYIQYFGIEILPFVASMQE